MALQLKNKTDLINNTKTATATAVCLLADTGSIHLEEGVVHEEVKGLLFPGTASVLVPTQTAQKLDASAVAGGVVGTARRYMKNSS